MKCIEKHERFLGEKLLTKVIGCMFNYVPMQTVPQLSRYGLMLPVIIFMKEKDDKISNMEKENNRN
jgi:hypothetical protein